MKVIEPGHIYELRQFDCVSADPPHNLLRFVNREPGHEHPGTITQQVLQALIDRTKHCDNCLRWVGNDLIIYHLRMALVLHEARALERKVAQGKLCAEFVHTGNDGHFCLNQENMDDKVAEGHYEIITPSSPCNYKDYESYDPTNRKK